MIQLDSKFATHNNGYRAAFHLWVSRSKPSLDNNRFSSSLSATSITWSMQMQYISSFSSELNKTWIGMFLRDEESAFVLAKIMCFTSLCIVDVGEALSLLTFFSSKLNKTWIGIFLRDRKVLLFWLKICVLLLCVPWTRVKR